MTSQPTWFKTPTAWWMSFAGIVALLIVPLFLVDIPPLLDYPNHLARIFVLTAGAKDPVVSRMYAPHWRLLPNLGFDVLMLGLVRLFPLYVAGRVVIGLTLVLQLAAVTLYSRALFKQRSYWPLVSAFIAYGAILLLGFISFLMGIDVALLTAAWWIHMREKRPAWAVAGGLAGALLVFFCHIAGIVLLAVLLGGYELDIVWRRIQERRPVLPSLVNRFLPAASILLPPVALALLYAPTVTGGVVMYPPIGALVDIFNIAFLSYARGLDIIAATALILFIALCCTRGVARLPRATAIQLTVFVLAFLVLPFRVSQEAWIDVRFAFMAAVVMFAGILPFAVPRRIWVPAAAVIVSLFVAHMAVVDDAWLQHRAVLAEFRQTIAPVPPGAKVLLVRARPRPGDRAMPGSPMSCRVAAPTPACDHVPALLVMERRAFWPLLFSVPWQQPVKVLPPYKKLSVPSGTVPDYRLLSWRHYGPLARRSFPYLPDWRDHFDYVLVLTTDARMKPGGMPKRGLALVRRTAVASLYRIEPAAPAPPSGTTAAVR